MHTVTLSSRFQITIPLELRRRLRLEPGATLTIVAFNGALHLLPLKAPTALRGIARGLSTEVEMAPDRQL